MNSLTNSIVMALDSTQPFTTVDMFNDSVNATEPPIDLFPSPRYLGRFLQTLTITIIFAAALIGNVMVILLCVKKPNELKVSRRLILHLAILNLNMTIFVLPSVIVSAAAQAWVMGDGWCTASGFFKNMFFVGMILNLVLISIDRYFSVVKPLHYFSSATVKYHSVFLVVIWVTSVLFALPPLVGWSEVKYHPSRYMCAADTNQEHSGYIIFVFIVAFLVPFFIMLFVYFTIYKAARRLMKRKQGRRLSADMTDSGSGSAGGAAYVQSSSEVGSRSSGSQRGSSISTSQNSSRGMFRRRSSKHRLNVSEEWKVAKTGVIVMASFIICWLPYYIVLMVDAAYGFGVTVPLSMAYAWWECFATWMALSACAINPYVYVLRSPPMRRQASRAAHNVWARIRECWEEDSRDIRRRESERGDRYSFRRLSNRFSFRKVRKQNGNSSNTSRSESLNHKDPEAQEVMLPVIPEAGSNEQATTPSLDRIEDKDSNANVEIATVVKDADSTHDSDSNASEEVLPHKIHTVENEVSNDSNDQGQVSESKTVCASRSTVTIVKVDLEAQAVTLPETINSEETSHRQVDKAEDSDSDVSCDELLPPKTRDE